jgi:diguanylate cyclase (GGDEF)-like protein
MEKSKFKLVITISLIVFISLFVYGAINFSAYSRVIKKDVSNITKLTASSIYSEINAELLKPIYVSLSMANNSFLNTWIEEDNEKNLNSISTYLKGIRDKYGYNSVFYVSKKTNNYYTVDGIFKKISKNDSHDVWYYDFMSRDLDYDIDIDTDEVANNKLTFFVNCKIYGANGDILGVTGVGLQLDRISSIMQSYDDELGVKVSLIDSEGTIQIHADERVIENYNLFSNQDILKIKNDIISSKREPMVFETNRKTFTDYLVSYYIEDLDWYLIVQKDTSDLYDSLISQLIRDLVIFFSLFIIVMFLSSKIIIFFQDRLVKASITDKLTNLNNRMMFDTCLKSTLKDAQKNKIPFTLAMFDIDNFKSINDKYGHDVGDSVLKAVAENISSLIRKDDIVARWGGDEFVIIFRCTLKDAITIVEREKNVKSDNALLEKYNITTCVGITSYKENDTEASIFKRVDKALLEAKRSGKGQIVSKK